MVSDSDADISNIVYLAKLQDEGELPAFTEEAIASEFAARHEHELRYVADWGHWLFYNDKRWERERTKCAMRAARKLCREAATDNDKPAVASHKTVMAVVNLATCDERLVAVTEQWDADPWALNTPEGVVDLRTGIIAPHQAEDYFTKISAVSPDPECPTPLWLAFLKRVTGDDPELIAFLQRMTGYSLTGTTREHALFFHHGIGANGKSTFFNVLSGILGDYHRTAPIETFIASHNERHPTDLAGLMGARLVSAIETEEGRRWDESKLKALTGGDPVSARFMRQDFFEYMPQFKLIIAGNDKPALRTVTVDEAIRRRLYLIPWAVVIPPAERDKTLGEKLRKEWPGILAWAVQGCLQWQEIGLAPPPAVTNATNAYMEAEDALGTWIGEYCMHDPNGWELTKTLFAGWKAWCEKSGEWIGTMKRFSQNLELRGPSYGIHYQRDRRGSGFRGVRLVGDAPNYAA
jgi:putative DNA primase/helicase